MGTFIVRLQTHWYTAVSRSRPHPHPLVCCGAAQVSVTEGEAAAHPADLRDPPPCPSNTAGRWQQAVASPPRTAGKPPRSIWAPVTSRRSAFCSSRGLCRRCQVGKGMSYVEKQQRDDLDRLTLTASLPSTRRRMRPMCLTRSATGRASWPQGTRTWGAAARPAGTAATSAAVGSEGDVTRAWRRSPAEGSRAGNAVTLKVLSSVNGEAALDWYSLGGRVFRRTTEGRERADMLLWGREDGLATTRGDTGRAANACATTVSSSANTNGSSELRKAASCFNRSASVVIDGAGAHARLTATIELSRNTLFGTPVDISLPSVSRFKLCAAAEAGVTAGKALWTVGDSKRMQSSAMRVMIEEYASHGICTIGATSCAPCPQNASTAAHHRASDNERRWRATRSSAASSPVPARASASSSTTNTSRPSMGTRPLPRTTARVSPTSVARPALTGGDTDAEVPTETSDARGRVMDRAPSR
jgi:hypothetical protein